MNKTEVEQQRGSEGLVDQDDEPPPSGTDGVSVGRIFHISPAARLSRPVAVPSMDVEPRPAVRRNKSRSLNPLARQFRRRHYPQTTDAEWSDWRWQMANRIRAIEQLQTMLVLSAAERQVLSAPDVMLPVCVTPHYMSLVAIDDPDQPIRRSVIPTVSESRRSFGEADDPLGEDRQSPLPGLVHRYPDRVLLLATDACSTYCRYCTRSRVVGQHRLPPLLPRMETAFDYIRSHPAIRDVLISGGDPLLLTDDRLEWILAGLRAIPHLEVIRIGTKTPAVLPQRITPALVRMLRKYHPLWMSLHFTHPDECVEETRCACERLADGGIPLGSQTVLLKGINDRVDVMRSLMHRLMQMRVRPYYLYQCDPITGSAHFRTSIETGCEIIRGLRGHTSGYAVPTYVVDAPGGGGKVPLMPETIVNRDAEGWSVRNYEDRIFRYPDAEQKS